MTTGVSRTPFLPIHVGGSQAQKALHNTSTFRLNSCSAKARIRWICLSRRAAREKGTDKVFSRGPIINIFYPVRDISDSGICLIFFQLVRYSDAWTKIRREVLRTEVPLTYDVVRSLEYTSAAFTEALRLLPLGSAPVRTALCLRSASLDGTEGIPITKGSKVVAHTHAVQRDVIVWGADANEYKPEH